MYFSLDTGLHFFIILSSWRQTLGNSVKGFPLGQVGLPELFFLGLIPFCDAWPCSTVMTCSILVIIVISNCNMKLKSLVLEASICCVTVSFSRLSQHVALFVYGTCLLCYLLITSSLSNEGLLVYCLLLLHLLTSTVTPEDFINYWTIWVCDQQQGGRIWP